MNQSLLVGFFKIYILDCISTNVLYSKVCCQHPAMFCLYTFPAHNLNFHWKWWDWIQAIFLYLFFTLKPQKLQNCLNFAIMSIECLMTPSSTPSWLLSKEIGYDFSADTSTYNAAVSLLRPLSQQFHHFISLYFTSLHSIALGAGYSKISPIHILHSVLCALIWRKVSTQFSYFFEKCFTGAGIKIL